MKVPLKVPLIRCGEEAQEAHRDKGEAEAQEGREAEPEPADQQVEQHQGQAENQPASEGEGVTGVLVDVLVQDQVGRSSYQSGRTTDVG